MHIPHIIRTFVSKIDKSGNVSIKKCNMKFYKNGNYIVCIKDDGTKIRRTDGGEFIPQFAENVDVKITSACRVGCPFCYEGCTKDGRHADLFGYPFIHSLHPYTEMALNGNDMDHPDLERFLLFLRERQVYANITVHQIQFMGNYERIKEYSENGLIHGIGISYYCRNDKFFDSVNTMPNAVIHVINGVFSPIDLQYTKNRGLKILILGYKELGRGIQYKKDWPSVVARNKAHLYDVLPQMINDEWFSLVSFDNLAIEQLQVKRLLSDGEWQEFYMGDDGDYTFYIDMVDGTFARNSLSQERYEIGNKSIDEMFNIVRK